MQQFVVIWLNIQTQYSDKKIIRNDNVKYYFAEIK